MKEEKEELFTSEELRKCLDHSGLKAIKLAEDLGVGRSTISNWINDKRKIDASTSMLLRLYFYGEIPFNVKTKPLDIQDSLSLSKQQWLVIGVLSKKAGFINEISWIRDRILNALDLERDRSEESPALRVAEDPSAYNIIDPKEQSGGESSLGEKQT